MRRTTPLLLLLVLLAGLARPASALTFSVTYIPQVGDSFTGRVYVMLSRSPREPRFGPVWFSSDPFFALDVEDWKPGEPLVFDDDAIGFPAPPSEVRAGSWSVQAVMRRNPDSPTIGRGVGTAFSPTRRLSLAPGRQVSLKIDDVVPERRLADTERVRFVEIESPLLSAFHGRPVTMSAAVVLPRDMTDGVRYPASYVVPGFGGDHSMTPWLARRWKGLPGDDRIVRVVLDPSCFGGHHVFADSANNGPRGRALVEELIPHLERTFPIVAEPGARFVTGHSSGGWSSLWLQVTHPRFFGGTWSTSPDPVDFRDFQRIDLYAADANMYTDADGGRRPIAREGERIIGWYRDMAMMEEAYGDGGQVRSFEWTFSPRSADGRPRPLFDRATGAVDPEVAETWRAYDIRRVLEKNWKTLAPDLAGKLHVITGDADNFYLEGAVRLLKESQQRLGSDAVIEIIPGASHSSVMTSALMERIDREMLASYDRSRRASPQAP